MTKNTKIYLALVLSTFITTVHANITPQAINDTVSTQKNTSIQIDVLTNDIGDFDVSSATISNYPVKGTCYFDSNGILHYSPEHNFYGLDSLTYTVQSTTGVVSNAATVYINIIGSNILPVAGDDYAACAYKDFIQIHIGANDYDLDGKIDSIVILDDHRKHFGSGIYTTSYFSYWAGDSTGIDTLSYYAIDNEGAHSNIANIYINVSMPTSIQNIEVGNVVVNFSPNPISSSSILSYKLPEMEKGIFSVIDSQGRIVKSIQLNQSTGTMLFDSSNMENGMYFYAIQGEGFFASGKFTVIK